MKTIFLIIVFLTSMNFAQSELLLLMDSGVSYINPLTYDATNTLALYDGDLELSTTAWNNQMSTSFDMSLTGEPSVTTSFTVNGTTWTRCELEGTATLATTIYLLISSDASQGDSSVYAIDNVISRKK